jgi:hypothetical protein
MIKQGAEGVCPTSFNVSTQKVADYETIPSVNLTNHPNGSNFFVHVENLSAYIISICSDYERAIF